MSAPAASFKNKTRSRSSSSSSSSSSSDEEAPVFAPVEEKKPQLFARPPVAASGRHGAGKQKEALKLRLDLNLEVEIAIQAKVNGDITLSLLQ